jgi:hypothetical protein
MDDRDSTPAHNSQAKRTAVMNYINRKGDVYFVFQGVTKTGKPKYYVSLKSKSDAGQQIDSLPDDFELHEDPIDARVSVRKKQPSEIHDFELEFMRDRVELEAKNVQARVVIQGRSLVIFESPDLGQFDYLSKHMGGLPSSALRQVQSRSQMSPAFRFKLISKEDRVFEAQRFCFRGGIDDWISLHRAGTLDELCQRYLKHLGKESFYELM